MRAMLATANGHAPWTLYEAVFYCFAVVSQGRRHEMKVARTLGFPVGTILIIDRSYVDNTWCVKEVNRTYPWVKKIG